MANKSALFDDAIRTSEEWLRSVAREFDTDDLHFAQRVLRAWLHGLCHALPVDVGAHLAAQLPELWRGVYYEGWDPSRVRVDHDVNAFVQRFAQEAQVRPTEVRRVASTVTAALQQRMSGGLLMTALERLPQRLRELLGPQDPQQPKSTTTDDRLALLEKQVQTLTDAMRELVHGLEHTPVDEPTENHLSEAAHRAQQILLAGQP